jgi:hypothetical protein
MNYINIFLILFGLVSNGANSSDISLSDKLKEIMSQNNQENKMFDRGQEDVWLIVQNEYGVLFAAKSQVKILATSPLGPCIGIIIYDEKNKVAALSHFCDGITPAECIDTMLNAMDRKIDSQRLKVYLRGGWMNYQAEFDNQILSMIQTIEKNDSLQLCSAEFSDCSRGCYYLDLIFDVETGELFTSFRSDEKAIKVTIENEREYIWKIIGEFSFNPNGAYLRKAKDNRVITVGKVQIN